MPPRKSSSASRAKKSGKGKKKVSPKAAAKPMPEVEDVEMKKEETKKEEEEVAVEEEVEVEEDTSQSPLVTLMHWKFLVSLPGDKLSTPQRSEIQTKIFDFIKEHDMAPLYAYMCEQLNVQVDTDLLEKMRATNKKELDELKAAIEEAKTNEGETEIREAVQAVAEYYAHIGDKEHGLEWYDETLEKTVGTGEKITIMFSKIHVALLWDDSKLFGELVKETSDMVEKGGDWEKRNLLGVYKAIHLISQRNFKEAALKMLDATATFTCYPLCGYNRFIFYTVLASMVSLDRVTLRKKVVKAPEILSVIREIPHLRDLLVSLYECKYGEFFVHLTRIAPYIVRDPYMSQHTGYYLREIRLVAYSQFLKSYSSVTCESMAAAFGVGADFLDKELSRFIAAGRLNCKIDKVAGTVITKRVDHRNLQYQETITQGDQLLNRIQRLSKLINY